MDVVSEAVVLVVEVPDPELELEPLPLFWRLDLRLLVPPVSCDSPSPLLDGGEVDTRSRL